MSTEQAVIPPESVNPATLPEASKSRKAELTKQFVTLGHPAYEAERAFAAANDRVSEDDLEALNFMLTTNGYAAVMPEDVEQVLADAEAAREEEAKAEAKAEKEAEAEAAPKEEKASKKG